MRSSFRRHLLLNGGIILASFVVFGGIFYFLSATLDGQVTAILASRATIVRRSLDLENLSKLKSDTAAAAELQKKTDALLPSQDSLIGFPQFITTLARNHALVLNFSFDGSPLPPSPPAPGSVEWSGSVEGEAVNIHSFMDELENKTTRFMVNVQKFVLTPNGASYRADLKGKVFFQENKTALP